MKIKTLFSILLFVDLVGFSQSVSAEEKKLYDNYVNFAEIMWLLEQDQPCIPGQSSFVVNEGYVEVMVKTNDSKKYPENFWLLTDVVINDPLVESNSFQDGLIYKKNDYRFYYNERGQIVKMVSDYVLNHNARKNGKNVTVYYYTRTFDITYSDDKIQRITETNYVFKSLKKISESKPLIVKTVELTGVTDSLITKKVIKSYVNEEDLTLEAPDELVTGHFYYPTGDYKIVYYEPDGKIHYQVHTFYNVRKLEEKVQKTTFDATGNVIMTERKYWYNSENTCTQEVVTSYKNQVFNGRTEYNYENKTEYRFNAQDELIFERQKDMFRQKDKETGAWSEWREFRFCVN